jgi:hypothetical protein
MLINENLNLDLIKNLNFEIPKLHKSSVMISFEHCYLLAKVYKEIIGIEDISHFSINISDKNDHLYVLSYNPQIAFNIFKNGTYVFNGSISPTYYKNFDIYTWDETYHPAKKQMLLNTMERKNNITKGVVLTKKTDDLLLMYSFATRKDGPGFESIIQENKQYFYSIGDYCFRMLNSITERVLSNSVNMDKNNLPLHSNVIKLSDYV